MLQTYNSKNKDILVYVNGELLHRSQAKISVFDSSVQGGDAVWEGLRVYKNGIFCLNRHIERLQDSAKALFFSDIPSEKYIKEAIFKTLKANNMRSGVHIRLTLTRGEKITSGMDPRLNTQNSCLIVLAEWKAPVYDNKKGISIITSAIRRNSPDHIDSKIHHNNLLNNILAKIQANVAGADDALMLDRSGFVSEMNGTNIFMLKKNVVYTPQTNTCLPGITREIVIEIVKNLEVDLFEKNLSLTEFYNADHVFATGTMGEITPITSIDGRIIENRFGKDLLKPIIKNFESIISKYSVPLPF